MNSKQAVYSVLEHKTPAYIPLGTYAIDCDTVEKLLGHETYVRNKVKTQIALWEGRRDEVVQSLKEDSVELFRKLDSIDVIIPQKEAVILPPADEAPARVKKVSENIWESEDGLVYQISNVTNDVTVVQDNRVYNIEDFDREPDKTIPDNSIFEAYDHLVNAMKDERFIAGASGGFDPLQLLGGMERGLMEYCLNPELIKKAQNYYLKMHNWNDSFYIKDDVDGIMIEYDFATTRGPLMSPEMLDEFVFPIIKSRVESIKKFKSKVILHCCGNTWSLLDRIIDIGIDCYQSLQTGTSMELPELKAHYGSRLAFWGGVSVEKLIAGTQQEVREDVRNAIKHGASEGGFILGPSHSIAYGTKYDNFMAMLDEHDKLKYITH